MKTIKPLQYPYYIVPLVEQYKKLDANCEEAKKLSRRIAANIGDYASLRLVLGIDPPEFARFYPDMETVTPDTFDTIDSFLDKFGGSSQPLGYMATHEREEGEEEDKKTEVKSENESLQELMNQHRYEEAIRLIEAQNLNNPNKSIYFAHQMRFLRKLIVLEKFRNQTMG